MGGVVMAAHTTKGLTMRTRSHLLAVTFAALLAAFGSSAAQARLAGNGTQTNGVWLKIMRNGTQTNGQRVHDGAAKAPGTPVMPQAATVTLPDGTTLRLR
jgi:hypothetical protein